MNITFYESTEAMLDGLSQAMQEADKRVKPWQAKIKKGDCFWHDTEYGFKIYGEVLRNAYRKKALRHYRFCKCYSAICPEGETGDVHVCIIGGLLTREEFAERIKAL